MSFLSFLDQALRQLGTHPPCERTAEITRSALRMKALYAELDARASAGDRSAASAPTPDLPPLHRLSGSESGVDSTLEFSRPLHRTVAGSGGELARSEAHARHPAVEAGLGEARGRQPAAPEVEVVEAAPMAECDFPRCGCPKPDAACVGFWTGNQPNV